MARSLAVSAAALVLAVLAACSSEDDVSSDSSDVVSGDRWVLPSEVLVVGAKARVTYDAAPIWTGTGSCAKALLEGTREVGEHVRERFSQVSSIGGYACRKNTADTSRMSVHGTGRALDVFIPKKGAGADSIKGDAVANWMVLNASKIGVQLVIWNHTVWRANGRNASAYGGPHPHDDHIHVEITNEAARMETPWFADKSDDDAGEDAAPRADAGTKDSGTKDSGTKDSGSPPPPPPPQPEEEAGTPPPKDPPKTPPKDEEDNDPPGTTPGSSSGEGPAPDHDWEVPEGETGDKDSLGTSSASSSKKKASDSDSGASAGCSASPVTTRDAAPIFLGIAIASVLVGRRRRGRR